MQNFKYINDIIINRTTSDVTTKSCEQNKCDINPCDSRPNTSEYNTMRKIVGNSLISNRFAIAMKYKDYSDIDDLVSTCRKFNIKYKFLRVAIQSRNMFIVKHLCNKSYFFGRKDIAIYTYNIIDSIKINDFEMTKYLLDNKKDHLNSGCLHDAIKIKNINMINLLFKYIKIYKPRLKILRTALKTRDVFVVQCVFNNYINSLKATGNIDKLIIRCDIIISFMMYNNLFHIIREYVPFHNLKSDSYMKVAYESENIDHLKYLLMKNVSTQNTKWLHKSQTFNEVFDLAHSVINLNTVRFEFDGVEYYLIYDYSHNINSCDRCKIPCNRCNDPNCRQNYPCSKINDKIGPGYIHAKCSKPCDSSNLCYECRPWNYHGKRGNRSCHRHTNHCGLYNVVYNPCIVDVVALQKDINDDEKLCNHKSIITKFANITSDIKDAHLKPIKPLINDLLPSCITDIICDYYLNFHNWCTLLKKCK
jgi:hypothetical protein